MAQSQPTQPSLSGADAIRSLQSDDSIFKAFDSYPWKKDTAFLSGLYAILGEPNQESPQGSFIDMATHARIFYYAQRIGVNIDFATYQAWLVKHPQHQVPDVLPDKYKVAQADKGKPAESVESTPSWQQAAPKAELYVDKSAASQSSGGGEPNYPMAFAEMIKLLQEGKPIPGIRQIPNTVARDPSVKPVGSRPAPRKPWEKNVASLAQDPQAARTLDSEFPPIDTDSLSSPVAEPLQS